MCSRSWEGRRVGAEPLLDHRKPAAGLGKEYGVLWQLVMRGHLLHLREEAQPEVRRLAKHVDEHEAIRRRVADSRRVRNSVTLEERACVHQHRLALRVVFGCQEGLDELFDAGGERSIGWR